MAKRKTTRKKAEPQTTLADLVPPKLVGESLASTATRSSKDHLADLRYPNLEKSKTPFCSYENGINAKDAIRLCVQAYWAFPLLRNVIEVMVELANGEIVLTEGNKRTRDFIYKWMKKTSISKLSEQYYREWWRTGNVFVFEIDGEFDSVSLKNLKEVFGGELKKSSIPMKFIILNPENITPSGDITFENAVYSKKLTNYEKARLKKPQTDSEKAFVDKIKNAVKNFDKDVSIPLDPAKLTVMLYKAQPYEPMGIPMAFGVLDDIEAKMELKRIDLALARTMDRALLLVTMGESLNEYNKGVNINYNHLAALQGMFQNESLSRTLVADWTTKAEWKIPEISNILGKAKYEQLDKDIRIGLNAVFFNDDEKFANASIKVTVFAERLKEARKNFIEHFLQPKIDQICDALNTKSTPKAHFEDISLKDELQFNKLVLSMTQMGLLTPAEMFESMKNGKIPSPEESIENQRAFKELRDEGLYMPIIGGSSKIQEDQLQIQKEANEIQKQQVSVKAPPKAAGRPEGTKAPQSTKNVKPIGTSKAEVSFNKLMEAYRTVGALRNEVDEQLKKKFKVKKFSEEQDKISSLITESIALNEAQENWQTSVASYLDNPKEVPMDKQEIVDEFMLKHDVTSYQACLLALSLE